MPQARPRGSVATVQRAGSLFAVLLPAVFLGVLVAAVVFRAGLAPPLVAAVLLVAVLLAPPLLAAVLFGAGLAGVLVAAAPAGPFGSPAAVVSRGALVAGVLCT